MKENLPETPHPQVDGSVDPYESQFCQEGSTVFNQEIDDDFGDWRVTRSRIAMRTGRDPDSRSPVYIGGKVR